MIRAILILIVVATSRCAMRLNARRMFGLATEETS